MTKSPPQTPTTTETTNTANSERARIETIVDELLDKVNGGMDRCVKCSGQTCNVRCSSRGGALA